MRKFISLSTGLSFNSRESNLLFHSIGYIFLFWNRSEIILPLSTEQIASQLLQQLMDGGIGSDEGREVQAIGG